MCLNSSILKTRISSSAIIIIVILSGCTVTYRSAPQFPIYIPAESIRFYGTVGFTLPSKSQQLVELRYDKIENKRSGGLSASTRITLWATKSKYDGQSLDGYIIAKKTWVN